VCTFYDVIVHQPQQIFQCGASQVAWCTVGQLIATRGQQGFGVASQWLAQNCDTTVIQKVAGLFASVPGVSERPVCLGFGGTVSVLPSPCLLQCYGLARRVPWDGVVLWPNLRSTSTALEDTFVLLPFCVLSFSPLLIRCLLAFYVTFSGWTSDSCSSKSKPCIPWWSCCCCTTQLVVLSAGDGLCRKLAENLSRHAQV
jgi:hypothetical protein